MECGDTGDVGRRHRRAVPCPRGRVAVRRRRRDAHTGRHNVHTVAVVGEGGEVVVGVARSHCRRRRLAGRRGVARVGILVAGCHSHEQSSRHRTRHGSVQCVRPASSQRHVGDALPRRGGGASCGPVHAGDDPGRRSRPRTRQHLDPDQRHPLGDAVRRPADSARDVGAVSVAVVVDSVSREVDVFHNTVAKLVVGPTDAGVDDVRVHTLPIVALGVVGVVQGQIDLIGAIKAPRTDGRRSDHRVLFDDLDVGVVAQRLHGLLRHAALGEAVEDGGELVGVVSGRCRRDRVTSGVVVARVELDDVAALDLW
mmetsp:Transcript_20446/g.48746  ORF Transcript_20446/g.48746 Transcript_20446/m.48746 type:complete len:311 (+) Transcript_20446:1050-1982(+)